MNRLFFFLIFILFCFRSYAQTDLNLLRETGDAYLNFKEYDSALSKYQQGYTLARSRGDDTAEGFFLCDIGYVYLVRNRLKDAQDYFDKSKTVGEDINDLNIQAYSYLNLGIIMKKRAVYERASEYLLKSIGFFKRTNDNEGLASAYNTLADLEKKQDKFTDALINHKLALNMRKQLAAQNTSERTSIDTDIASSLNNIGEVYKDIGQYDSARYYLFLALIKKKKLPNTLLQASTLTALAEIDQAEGKTNQALSNYLEAYTIRKQHNERVGVSNSANLIGNLLIKKGSLSKAAPFIDEALNIASSDSINDELLASYDLKRKFFRLRNEYDSAFFYDDLYILQSRVVFNEKASRAIEDMEAKYELKEIEEEYRSEAQKNLLEAQKKDALMVLMAVGIGAVVMIASITVFAYYRKKKDNLKLDIARRNAEEAKEQIEALWKELNHRIKNNFQTLSSMLSIQGAQIEDEMMKKIFDDMENRVLVMGVMHRKLYANKKFTLISIHTLINDLVEDLKISFNGEHVDISCELQAVDMDADKAIPMGLIVNEILTNAFKYAFDGHADPRLDIKLSSEGKTVMLVVSDNGPGIPEEKTNSQASFGFTLIRIFTKQLGGSFSFENRNGACIRLVINR